MAKPKILVFASGEAAADSGGSGFQKLVEASRSGILSADIVAVVSNHANGGVRTKADALEIPFVHFPGKWTAERYQEIAQESKAQWFALSGWIKPVRGLDLQTAFNSRTTFNIHPALLPSRFGGKGMYGHHVHAAVMDAYATGEVVESGLSMHFVTEEYDQGPVFFRYTVLIDEKDDSKILQKRIGLQEHIWQSPVTNLVVNGKIAWDGIHPESLQLPRGYVIDHAA